MYFYYFLAARHFEKNVFIMVRQAFLVGGGEKKHVNWKNVVRKEANKLKNLRIKSIKVKSLTKT